MLHRFNQTSHTFDQYFTNPELITDIPQATQEQRNLFGLHQINALLEDSEGRLWVGKFGGLYLFNDSVKTEVGGPRYYGEDSQFTKFLLPTDSPNDSNNGVAALHEDRNGRLWVGTHQGLYTFERKNGVFTKFPNQPTDFSVSSIYEDRFGILWVGSMGNGLLKLEPWKNPFTIYKHEPGNSNSIAPGQPLGIQKDNDGALWIGTSALNRIDPSGTVKQYRFDSLDPSTISSGGVEALYRDGKRRLWAGGRLDGMISYMDPERPDYFVRIEGPRPRVPLVMGSVSITDILEDSNEHLWFSVFNVGISRLDRQTGAFINYTPESHNIGGEWGLKLYEAPSEPGILWIGRLGGLTRFDTNLERFTNYDYEYLRGVVGMLEDQNGDFWLASMRAGGGLHRFDRDTGQILETFTAEDGLGNSLVYGLFEDNQGFFWLSTRNGISKFDPDSKTFRNYDERDGIPENLFADLFIRAAIYQHNDGELFFGGTNGLVSFYPDDLVENSTPPLVVITDLMIRNERAGIGPGQVLDASMQMTEAISLAYDQNDITFEFVGLHFTDPAQNKYRYWLEGYEDQWIEAGAQRLARYTNLDPDEYVFHVSAANSDGVWNEVGASVRVTIRPPWWQSPWAYLFYTVFGFVAAIAAISSFRHRLVRLERERAMMRELEQAKEIETQNRQLKEQERQLESQNKQLTKQKERLLQLDTAKSRFFANISHEFRTPLTLILGPLEQHLKRKTFAVQHRELSMMHRQAQRLLHLINQLLDLSRLDSGRLTLQAKRFDLVPILNTLVEAFAHRAKRENISFQFVSLIDCAPAYIDPDKFEIVFSNLLSNAFKFTPSGGDIQLSLSDEVNGQDAYWVCTLKDTGVGISPDELPYLFDRFYQVDASTTRKHGGSGIGLALAKEIVDLHRGDIRVYSKPDMGTTFTVSFRQGSNHLHEEEIVDTLTLSVANGLPIDEREQFDELAEESETASPDAPMVLVVEDNTDVREFIRSNLEKDYRVMEAVDGQHGLERTREEHPDLVIADVMMPRLDGIALCRAIKNDETLAPIPVILLTARAEEEDRIEGLGTGADDYITKPFSITELLIRVENLIEVRRALRKRYSDELIFQPGDVTVTSEEAVFLKNIRSVIEAELGNSNFTVEALADAVGLGKRQLFRKVKSLTSLSPGGLIRTMRLQRAAQLFKQKAGRVSEVAYAVGFNDVRHFSRLFRQAFGEKPSEYE